MSSHLEELSASRGGHGAEVEQSTPFQFPPYQPMCKTLNASVEQ